MTPVREREATHAGVDRKSARFCRPAAIEPSETSSVLPASRFDAHRSQRWTRARKTCVIDLDRTLSEARASTTTPATRKAGAIVRDGAAPRATTARICDDLSELELS